MTARPGACRVSLPETPADFFGHHDTATYLLETCTGERVRGYYRELYSVFHNRVEHTASCNEFNKQHANASVEVHRPGDCAVV